MSMLHIGAGGWAYFKVRGMDSLAAYSNAFDFVELNSTFYTIPSMRMVRSWRQRVPDNFMFSVRCHKDLTHRYLLSPREESYEILIQSLRICSKLKAEILHIQTPPTFDPDENPNAFMICSHQLILAMSDWPGRYAGRYQIEARRREEAQEAWKTCLKYNPSQESAKKNLKDCTNAYGMGKSPVGMDDLWAFVDLKQQEYLSVKGRDNFDETDDEKAILKNIMDAWNAHIAGKFGATLDRMKSKEKMKVFNEIKVFTE